MAGPSKARKKALAEGRRFQLKITLRRSKPPIWRRILVPADCTLGILHHAIQAAMGWENCHLHGFSIGDEDRIGFAPEDGPLDSNELDASEDRLCDLAGEKSKFKYQYDFGDSWVHIIRVEKIVPPLLAPTSPAAAQPFACLAGKGACPPEDCGGIWSYYDLIEVLQDPKHPEHKEMKAWHGDIDPAAFDLAAANRRLSRIQPG